jgi:hypothetical protein
MTSRQDDKRASAPGSNDAAVRWLRIGGGVALVLALVMVLLAWHRASEGRQSAEDIKARVAAEMNRIEAEAARMERNAAQ